jgi:hypothetical protein
MGLLLTFHGFKWIHEKLGVLASEFDGPCHLFWHLRCRISNFPWAQPHRFFDPMRQAACCVVRKGNWDYRGLLTSGMTGPEVYYTSRFISFFNHLRWLKKKRFGVFFIVTTSQIGIGMQLCCNQWRFRAQWGDNLAHVWGYYIMSGPRENKILRTSLYLLSLNGKNGKVNLT